MKRILTLSLLCLSILQLNAMETKPMNTMMPQDPEMLWAEEVLGEKALAWVRKHNERSLTTLKAHARYAELETEAKNILTSKERIPYGSVRDGYVYNFWQDETHIRGLWRRTPVEEYSKESPVWETILDLDALSEAEGKIGSSKAAIPSNPKVQRTTIT